MLSVLVVVGNRHKVRARKESIYHIPPISGVLQCTVARNQYFTQSETLIYHMSDNDVYSRIC